MTTTNDTRPRVTLTKASVTNAFLTRSTADLAKLPPLGNRSGKVGSEFRLAGDAIRSLVLVALYTGKSVELTEQVRVLMSDDAKANEYHTAWSRVRTFEKLLGEQFVVTMFTEVEKETKASITGITSTSTGHGRVFVTLA